MYAGHDFTAHHDRPVEAHRLNTPSLQPLPHDQSHSCLRSPFHRAHFLGAHYVITHAVMAVCLVWVIHIRQKHQVIVLYLHGMDELGGGESPAIPDIVRSEVDPWGAEWPAP